MSRHHFEKKQEEISNTFMSANGVPIQQAQGSAEGRAAKSIAGKALGFGLLALSLAVPIAIIYIAVKMSKQK